MRYENADEYLVCDKWPRVCVALQNRLSLRNILGSLIDDLRGDSFHGVASLHTYFPAIFSQEVIKLLCFLP